jgi:hypothetical protein
MQRGETDRQQILDWLDQSLRRVSDRALFGLQPLPDLKASPAGD